MAKELGADMTFQIKTKDGREVADNIVKGFGESNKSIECTGVESSITSAIYVRFSPIIFTLIYILRSIAWLKIAKKITLEVVTILTLIIPCYHTTISRGCADLLFALFFIFRLSARGGQ